VLAPPGQQAAPAGAPPAQQAAPAQQQDIPLTKEGIPSRWEPTTPEARAAMGYDQPAASPVVNAVTGQPTEKKGFTPQSTEPSPQQAAPVRETEPAKPIRNVEPGFTDAEVDNMIAKIPKFRERYNEKQIRDIARRYRETGEVTKAEMDIMWGIYWDSRAAGIQGMSQ
jgi:hypothetical protein